MPAVLAIEIVALLLALIGGPAIALLVCAVLVCLTLASWPQHSSYP